MSIFKRAEITARKFLKMNNLTTPIDLEKAAQILGVKIAYVSFEGQGALVYNDNFNSDKKLIIVSANQTREQLRFNIAHELAHILLKHCNTILQTHPEEDKPNYEKEANICASELLIPRNKVKQAFYKYSGDIKKLKNHFQVSEQAMVTKMEILNLPYENTFYN
ncbi:ImmA/IrrE family metallo-endopeptidase [Natroniella sp. ANB-PHB2]|uniref:ImmA/IrrE family metallo-endopeptidase n=1 Tax=Natroniella sp. ANB-PHB2 TaxID=3384444 RepID=UPI0038D3C955